MQNNTYQPDATQLWVVGGVIVVTVAVLGIALFLLNPKSHPAVVITDPTALANMQTGNAPWIPEKDGLKSRLNAMGLPALTAEGTTLHIHQHLDIYIDGKVVAVPATIGINQAQNFISPLHVHDTTGVIHVESPTVQDFTLGQFFDIWGVKFTKDCIGDYCATADKTLAVYVNGQAFSEDPRTIVLTAHQEIAVVYGTASEKPNPIPATYAFPADE